MNSIVIKPSTLKGTVVAPPSKSISHRAIICAALSAGPCVIKNVMLSEDIKATIECIKLLGTQVNAVGENEKTYRLTITRHSKAVSCPVFDCVESGSTLRFIIPIAMAICGESTFTGSGKLCERPLRDYYKIFDNCSIPYSNDNGRLPLHVMGSLKNGSYSLSGNVSSQFISGLLMALPMLDGKSEIRITDELESKGYIDMTLKVMDDFGILVQNSAYKSFTIDGSSRYMPSDYVVEGDYSQAAFFLTAASIGNEVICEGLNPLSLQGDREITSILSMYDSSCGPVTIDASQIPDLVPIISVRAALKDGVTTHITHAARLRIKESDRLSSTATELARIGADVEELPEGLIIRGKQSLRGGACVDSWNDHRIAMALAVAATACENPIELTGYEAVRKSYPSFWQDYMALGGDVHGLCLERQD